MNTKLKIITLFILLISACQKDQLEPGNQQAEEPQTLVLTKKEAMNFVANLGLDSNKILSKIKVNWDLAKNEVTKKYYYFAD